MNAAIHRIAFTGFFCLFVLLCGIILVILWQFCVLAVELVIQRSVFQRILHIIVSYDIIIVVIIIIMFV